jgi:hypothetical protein
MAYVSFHSSAPCGFLIVKTDGDPNNEADTQLVQSDWDFPAIAGRMGWDMGKTEECDHSDSDGTVTCDCGKTSSDFISEASDYIREHEDEEFDQLDEYFYS